MLLNCVACLAPLTESEMAHCQAASLVDPICRLCLAAIDSYNPKRDIYLIPNANLGELNSKLEKLNKRAAKLGCEPVVTKVLGVVPRIIKEGLDSYVRTYYEIQITGAAPKLPGSWQFLGTLEHTPAGNILRAVPGQEIPETYRNAPAQCDHCQKIRRRIDIYVVRNEAGEFKQVGHQCVRDYLGHVDPKQFAMLAEYLRTFEEASGDEGGGGWGGKPMATPLDFLTVAAACVLRWGYMSRQALNNGYMGENKIATSSRAWSYLFPPPDTKKDEDYKEFRRNGLTEKARELAEATLEWAKHLTGSPFNQNVAITAQLELIDHSHIGILAWAVYGYQKEQGKIQMRERLKKEGAKSKHFGEIEKRADYELTITDIRSFASDYYRDGVKLVRMVDASGNIALWWTGSADKTGSLKIGSTYKVRATVKRHDFYKDTAQTVLSRCVMDEVKS